MDQQLTWLVTGCTSGMGESLVYAILEAGDRVIATARSREISAVERLAHLKKAGAAVMELDVAAPEDEIKEKAKEAWSIYGQVDVLVNNAAYIDAGIFEETDEAFLMKSLRNNAIGPLNLTRALLPYMRSRETGTLLFMSSVGAYYGSPLSGAYVSSKGLLEVMALTIGREVEPFGIRTSIVTPGFFRTKVFSPENMLYQAPNPLPEYAEMTATIRGMCDQLDGRQPGDPRKAGDIIVEAVKGVGQCTGKKLPPWLPLGPDAVEAFRLTSHAKMKICDEWEGVASSTNV